MKRSKLNAMSVRMPVRHFLVTHAPPRVTESNLFTQTEIRKADLMLHVLHLHERYRVF